MSETSVHDDACSLGNARATRSPGIEPRRVKLERRAASTLTCTAFQREYVAKNRPVVVENALPACPASLQWTPAFFRERFGDRPIQVSPSEQMGFADFIDAVLASREDAPGPYMYRLFIGPHLPELLPELEPFNPYAFPRRLASPLMPQRWRRPDGYLKLLIGGAGGRFPFLHYDLENAHAAITEIYGEKEFVLYPPEDAACLYPKPAMPNQSTIPDVQRVDPEQFPLYAGATQYHTVLHPGDMVFVPSRWWHGARALGPSISICQNMLDASNWRGYVSELCSPGSGLAGPKRQAKRAYLTALGTVLSTLERWPRRAAPRRLARLAPTVLAEADGPANWPTDRWPAR